MVISFHIIDYAFTLFIIYAIITTSLLPVRNIQFIFITEPSSGLYFLHPPDNLISQVSGQTAEDHAADDVCRIMYIQI